MSIWILSCVIYIVYWDILRVFWYTTKSQSENVFRYMDSLLFAADSATTNQPWSLPAKEEDGRPLNAFQYRQYKKPHSFWWDGVPHMRWKAMTHPDHDTHGDCLDIPVPVTHETEVANATFLQWLSHVWFPGGKCSCLRWDPYLVGETNKEQQQNSLNHHRFMAVKMLLRPSQILGISKHPEVAKPCVSGCFCWGRDSLINH